MEGFLDEHGGVRFLNPNLAVRIEQPHSILYYKDNTWNTTHLMYWGSELPKDEQRIFQKILDVRNIISNGYFIDLTQRSIDGEYFDKLWDGEYIFFKNFVFDSNEMKITSVPIKDENYPNEEEVREICNKIDAISKLYYLKADKESFVSKKDMLEIEKYAPTDRNPFMPY